MLNYVDSCNELAVETLQNIIIISPAIPIVIAIIVSLITFISLIPQYFKVFFKDLKDSRDKKILNAIREEVIKEIYEQRNNNLSTISRFETKNTNLQREVETLERKIRTYDNQLKDLEKVRNILAR